MTGSSYWLKGYWLKGGLPALGIALVVVLVGCPSGTLLGDFVTAGLQQNGGTIAPAVTGGLTLQATGTDTIRVSWTAATDDATPSEQLAYRVVYSTTEADVATKDAALQTFAGITANSATKGAFSSINISSQEITGLTQETRYYVNVVVLDAAATPNSTAYGVANAAPRGGDIVVLGPDDQATTSYTQSFAENASHDRSFRIRNDGIGDLVVSSWTFEETAGGAFFDYSVPSPTPPLATLGPGQTSDPITLRVTTTASAGGNSGTANWTFVSSDPDGNKTVQLNVSSPDATAPSVSGGLTLDGTSTNTVRVTWAAASDNSTAAADLQYRLVYSSTEADVATKDATLQTFDAIATNNATRGKFSGTNITSQEVTGLTQETRYYFNVVVFDSVGTANSAAYGTANGAPQGGDIVILGPGGTPVTSRYQESSLAQGQSHVREFRVRNDGVGDLVVTGWSISEIIDDDNVFSYVITGPSTPLPALKPGDTSELISLTITIAPSSGGSPGVANWSFSSTDPDGDRTIEVDLESSYY